MDNELDSFLKTTEHTACSITPTVSKALSYPFLYITKLTTVELEYLVERHAIERSKISDEHIALYLKTESGGYRLLGYSKLSFTTIIKLNQLRNQDIMLKVNKETEQAVSTLIDSLLLT